MDFITTAYAASGTAAQGGAGSSTLIMILLMIGIFYFIIIRPENKRKKEAENMRNTLKKGDWLTTIGGVYGRVVTVTDKTVVIETSEDRVRLEFIKGAIGSVGSLEQQEAAQQQRGGLFGKKKGTEQQAVPQETETKDEEVGEEKAE